MEPINENLMWMIAATFLALSIGTVIRLGALRKAPADVVEQRLGSLKVWWILVLLWSTAALFGQIGATVLLATASFIGLREYLRLIGTSKEIGRVTIVCLMVLGVIHYALILSGASETAKWFLPVSGLLTIGAVHALTCSVVGYLRITAGVYWGLLLLFYGLSHSLFLFEIDTVSEPVVGNVGSFLFLVLLTEMNDIMQAIVGRKFGKLKISPNVSPNKSLEGLLGGLTATIALSVALAPIMTTITLGRSLMQGLALSVIAGILISLVGFLGDIHMSAIKRDAGVKDGSSLLPGMGGMIDRIDSLTFTGPAFYYFVVLLNQYTHRVNVVN